jgi:hypothetical protein
MNYRDDIEKIRTQLHGIEWVAATILYVLQYALLSTWVSRWLVRWVAPARAVEWYVVPSVGITLANWLFGPWFWLSVICSYFAVGTIIVLLHVVFVSKAVGDVLSPERTLWLFICNLVQIVFTFATWYHFVGYSKDDALFYSMVVLSTAGYPEKAHAIVELQIASNLLLIVIFLSYILGKVGRTEPSNPS